MDMEKVKSAQSQDEARNYAIEWQNWASEQDLSWGEIQEWADVFEELGRKFGFALYREFRENGII